MGESQNKTSWPGLALRWIARLGSLASIGLLLAFMFGGEEALPDFSEAFSAGFLFFPLGVMLGMAVGWWKELVGGLITVICLAGFYVWHLVVAGHINIGPYFILFAVPGFLFLGAWLAARPTGRPDNPAD